MVTLITEKLRNQSLDEVEFAPITQSTRRSWELTATEASAFKFRVGATDWSLLHPDSGHCPEGNDAPGSTPSINMTVSHSRPLNVCSDGLCKHNRRLLTCSLCLFVSGTPPTPPKKRHCRSLSIPGDGKCGRKWQPQASSIWRPVALRPHHTSGKGHKNRNSPLALHKRDKASSSSPLGGAALGINHPGNSSQSPGVGIWYVGSDCFSTPPESPVPRPASASSGFYDSSTGSLNVVGFDTSPVQGTTGGASGAYLKTRSFSMEEPISATLCGVRGNGGGWSSTGNTGSVPVMSTQNVQSTPSSPLRYHIPRCRSQPCELLHERKSGLKRRRDEERPALDFFKMKETAFTRTRHRSLQYGQQDNRCSSNRSSLFSLLLEPPECFFGLNTIASSPLDSGATIQQASRSSVSPAPQVFRRSPKDGATVGNMPQYTRRKNTDDDGCCNDDGCSDSGWSDVNDPPDIVGFVDSEDTSCSCDEPDHEDDKMTDATTTDEQVFELEMNNDIDLEQIEKD